LGKLADLTAGRVDMVDPITIQQNFGELLANPVLATNLQFTCIVHPTLFLVDESGKVAEKISKDVGNVNLTTEATFQFGVIRRTNLLQVPFQAQIKYRLLDGSHRLHVVTMMRPITENKVQAEEDVDVMVVGVHVSKISAQLVQEGKYLLAQDVASNYGEVLKGAAKSPIQKQQYQQFVKELHDGETALQFANKTEQLRGLNLDSLDESMDIASLHSAVRADETAAKMYQLKSSKAANCIVQ